MAANEVLFGFNLQQKKSLAGFVDEAVEAGATPLATTATAGTVKKAATVAAAAVPFADLTAAANSFNALRTSLINAGILSAT